MQLHLRDSEMAAIERRETASVEAYENRSRAMMNIMDGSPQALDHAILLLEKATTQDPEYAAAWAALALAYDFKGSFTSLRELSEKAVTVGRRAIQLDPSLADAHRWLGSALLSLGRFDEAISAIGEAVRLEPDGAGAHQSLARGYWIGRGDIVAGIGELERAIAINPDLGYAHLQLGLLYALQGRYVEAERSCNVAVDLQERFVSGKEGLRIVGAHTRLGYGHYLQGRPLEAIPLYQQEVAALSASDHALKERSLIELQVKLSAAHQALGQTEEATGTSRQRSPASNGGSHVAQTTRRRSTTSPPCMGCAAMSRKPSGICVNRSRRCQPSTARVRRPTPTSTPSGPTRPSPTHSRCRRPDSGVRYDARDNLARRILATFGRYLHAAASDSRALRPDRDLGTCHHPVDPHAHLRRQPVVWSRQGYGAGHPGLQGRDGPGKRQGRRLTALATRVHTKGPRHASRVSVLFLSLR